MDGTRCELLARDPFAAGQLVSSLGDGGGGDLAEPGVFSQLVAPPQKVTGGVLRSCQPGDFHLDVTVDKIAYRVLLGF